jgi:hypothetical protein
LLNKKGLDLKGDPQWTYGLDGGADFFASDITIDQGDYLFNVQTGDWCWKGRPLHGWPA